MDELDRLKVRMYAEEHHRKTRVVSSRYDYRLIALMSTALFAGMIFSYIVA